MITYEKQIWYLRQLRENYAHLSGIPSVRFHRLIQKEIPMIEQAECIQTLENKKLIQMVSNDKRFTGEDSLVIRLTADGLEEVMRFDREELIRIGHDRFEAQQVRNNNMIRYLTIVIAFGTSVAALYYANELCKNYHWFPFCHC